MVLRQAGWQRSRLIRGGRDPRRLSPPRSHPGADPCHAPRRRVHTGPWPHRRARRRKSGLMTCTRASTAASGPQRTGPAASPTPHLSRRKWVLLCPQPMSPRPFLRAVAIWDHGSRSAHRGLSSTDHEHLHRCEHREVGKVPLAALSQDSPGADEVSGPRSGCTGRDGQTSLSPQGRLDVLPAMK